jgi:hypothetical protein
MRVRVQYGVRVEKSLCNSHASYSRLRIKVIKKRICSIEPWRPRKTKLTTPQWGLTSRRRRRLVEVQAPCDLSEGYILSVEIHGKQAVVAVVCILNVNKGCICIRKVPCCLIVYFEVKDTMRCDFLSYVAGILYGSPLDDTTRSETVALDCLGEFFSCVVSLTPAFPSFSSIGSPPGAFRKVKTSMER